MKKLMLAGLALSPSALFAAVADPAGVVTTATTTFEAVSVLVVAMVGFFILVRIVKGIRK